jgi:Aspartate/tyrosine/aromatic aminotransferase
LEALKNPDATFVQTMRSAFEKRRDLAYNLLRDIPNLSVVKPKGAFYIFPNLSYYSSKLGSDLALAEFLLEKGRVAGVPGSAFGREGYLRLSYCLSEDTIKEGIERLKNTLALLES